MSRFSAATSHSRFRIVTEICSRLIGNVELKLNNGGSRRLTPGDIALLAPVSDEAEDAREILRRLHLL